MFSNSVSSHLYFGGSLIICSSTRFFKKKSSFSFSTKSFEISHSTLIFCTIYITGNFEIETPKCEKKKTNLSVIFFWQQCFAVHLEIFTENIFVHILGKLEIKFLVFSLLWVYYDKIKSLVEKKRRIKFSIQNSIST